MQTPAILALLILVHFTAAATLRAQDSQPLFNQALAKLDAKQLAVAFEMLSRLAEREPEELATRAYLVRAALELNNGSAARDNLLLLRRLAPDDGPLHAQLVEWCFAFEGAALSSDQIQFTLGLPLSAPQKARLYYLRGVLFQRSGGAQWAEEDLRRAIAIDPSQEIYVTALASIQGRDEPKKIDPALLAAGLARFPRSTDLLALDAVRQLDLGNFSQARSAQAALARIDPRSASAHTVLGRIELAELNIESAAAAFRSALIAGPGDSSAHYYLALCYRKLGQDPRSITEFKEAIRLNPAHAPSHFEYGRVLYDNGKLDEAKAALEAAIRIAPNLAGPYYLLGEVERRSGNVDAARRLRAKFKELNKE